MEYTEHREYSLENMPPHTYIVVAGMGAWDIRKYDGESTWSIYPNVSALEPISTGFESASAAVAACILMKGL